jgi:putative transposase
VQLSALLTEARGVTPWLRDGASVPQQQTIRDFGKSRAKALKDIKDRLPVRQRAGMPKPRAKAQKKVARQRQDTARKWAKAVVRDHDEIAVEDFKPRFLAKSTMARKAADAAIGATKRALIETARRYGRTVHLVNPAHTTMDCAHCGARAKHRLPLSERTYTCTACGTSSPRDKNSAHVMLIRAGLNPADADRTGPERPQDAQAA